MTAALLARAGVSSSSTPSPCTKTGDTTLIIAGHGTAKNENSRKAIEQQVALIGARREYADVRAVFLEEEPRVESCYELATTRNIVVVPFFISDGLHSFEEIPVKLGEPKTRAATPDRRQANLGESHRAAGQTRLVLAQHRHRAVYS